MEKEIKSVEEIALPPEIAKQMASGISLNITEEVYDIFLSYPDIQFCFYHSLKNGEKIKVIIGLINQGASNGK
jgi:hypothetical protein